MDQANLDRRSFFKGAAAVAAAGALPLVLGGCAQESASLPATGADGARVKTGLTDEERMAATPDPSYMGGSTNFCGEEVVVGTGPDGEVANQKLIDVQTEYRPAHLVKVTDRIYSAVGNALSDSTIVFGDTGVIVIDNGESIETAQEDIKLFQTIEGYADKPIVALIYTHNHYVGGGQAYIPADNPDNIPIIAQEKFMTALLSPFTETATCYVDRAHFMFGDYLPIEGEDGRVTCGLGAFYSNPYVESNTSGMIPPNTLIPADEDEVVMTIDGLTFHFYPTVSDSADNINVYIEEENTVVTNQAWGVMYNMYTIRGEKYRDPVQNIAAIDRLLALNADNVISVHGIPLIGRDVARKELQLERDAMQFVYDQTIRYMNKGYTPDQIVAAVKIPSFLANGAWTRPLYGEFEHYVRGVYSGLTGWFGGDPMELHPVSKSFQSAYIVNAAGGEANVVADAQTVLDDNQYAWAAQLATYVLDVNPENADAKAIKGQALRKMGQVAGAANTRHWYTTKAWEVEGKLDRSVVAAVITRDKLAAAPRKLVLDMLRCSIDPDKAMDMEESLILTYADEGISNSMSIRNCVGAVSEGRVENPSVELSMDYQTMLDIVLKERSFDECLQAGDIEVIGDAEKLAAIMGVCEMEL